MIALSESVITNRVQRPLADYAHDVSSSLQEIIINSETVRDGDEISLDQF